MICRKSFPKGTPFRIMTYSFLKPALLRIRKTDSTTILVGYGIGDQIEVLEPSCQFLPTNNDFMAEIPLPDGSFIIEYPKDIKVQRVVNT